MEEEYIDITILDKDGDLDVLENEIISSINGYLVRNKGGVSDFNLIKDITERTVGTIENEIEVMIPIPLYLGLAGTMIGIVVGLFSMPSIDSNNFESSIDVLIGGVKIAMIASFSGLILTVINSGYSFKKAKTYTEKQKNLFYTFLQMELMPAISQNLTASIYSLQSNLVEFNKTFKTNIGNFDNSLQGISEVFNSQVELIRELKELDMVELSKLNLTVLGELRSSTREFEKFNKYLQLLNSFVENAEMLNHNLTRQLDRTVAIEGIASEIGKNINLNKSLMQWLQDSMVEISDRKDMMKHVVIDVDNNMKKALGELDAATHESIKSIQKITIKEETLLEELWKDYRGNLDELKKLSEMNNGLDNLNSGIKEQNKLIKDQNETIKSLVTSISKNKPNSDSIITLEGNNKSFWQDAPLLLKYGIYTFFFSATMICMFIIIKFLYSLI